MLVVLNLLQNNMYVVRIHTMLYMFCGYTKSFYNL